MSNHTPLALIEDGTYNCTMQFLQNALAIFEQWKAAGQSELTSETFIACIQSIKSIIVPASHLICMVLNTRCV